MMRKAFGIFLSLALVLSACASPNLDKKQSGADQAVEAISEDDSDTTDIEQQKEEENKILEKFQNLAEETFPEKIQRSLSWETKECSDNLIGTVTVPILDENGMQDISWFCEDICDWIEICLNEITYDEAPWIYREIIVNFGSSSDSFNPSFYISNHYNRKTLYNGIYDFVDYKLNNPDSHSDRQTDYGALIFDDKANTEDFSDYEADSSYQTGNGITYEMVPVDRAAGSSYFYLISYKNGRDESIVINDNPFNGSGGESTWITFIDDTCLGFACLTYSGGDYALLFRTTNGGHSFKQINYPSAKIELSDGTVYNPFVIPEKVWSEDGNLYMLVGQSQWSGDYYSEELGKYPSGLYISHDYGASFEYLGEQ